MVLTIDVAPSHPGHLRRPAAGKHPRQVVEEARQQGDATVAQIVVLRVQLREAVPLHAERPRRPHRRLEIHALPARRRRPDRHKAELYNIEIDPEERYNLIDDPKYAGVVKRMQAELLKLMNEVGLTPETDKMPLDLGIKKELPDQRIR